MFINKFYMLYVFIYFFFEKLNHECEKIFQAETGRHVIGDREWEVYRVLLGDDYDLSTARSKIIEGVTRMLMGWD